MHCSGQLSDIKYLFLNIKLTELLSFLLLFLCLIHFEIQHFDFQFNFSKSAQSLLLSCMTTERSEQLCRGQDGYANSVRIPTWDIQRGRNKFFINLYSFHFDYILDSDKFRPPLSSVCSIRTSVCSIRTSV